MSTFYGEKLDQLVRAIFCSSSNIFKRGGGEARSREKDLSKVLQTTPRR